MDPDFPFEYEYSPLPDAEERLALAWDLILTLILEDYEDEQKEKPTSESDPC